MRILKNIFPVVCFLLLGSCNKATVESVDNSPAGLILGKWGAIDMAGGGIEVEPGDGYIFTLNFITDEKVERAIPEDLDEEGKPIIESIIYKWSPDHSSLYFYEDDGLQTFQILTLNRNQLSYKGRDGIIYFLEKVR